MFAPSRKSSSVVSLLALADEFLLREGVVASEGISYAGYSGQTDGGRPGPMGGGPSNGGDEDQQQPDDFAKNDVPESVSCPDCGGPTHRTGGSRGMNSNAHTRTCTTCGVGFEHIREDDVLAFSGSGPITFLNPQAQLPWRKQIYRGLPKKKVAETEGYMIGYATDSTLTGKIQITILDSVNIRVLAPFRILERIEAYHFFEQFQFLLPRTPMLNETVMWQVASWWRNFAEKGDLLEIDCTNGFATVTNQMTGNLYALGCFGNIPTYTGIVS